MRTATLPRLRTTLPRLRTLARLRLKPSSRRSTPRPDPAITDFQDDIDALVAEPPPRLLRLWPALGALLLLALVAFAALARIDITVTAAGRLVPQTPPVLLAPIDRAVLRELAVRPGERVHAGQLLALLDATFTAADRDALAAQRRSLTAQRDRLEAERDGIAPPPAANPDQALQAAVLAERRAAHAARRAAHEADIAALRAALAAEHRAAGGIAEQHAIATEVETMRARLVESQVGSRLALLAARAGRLEADRDQQRHESRLDELTLRLAARIAERDAWLRDWQRAIAEDLARLRPELVSIDERLAKAQRLDSLTELRAPTDAVVLEVAKRAPGSLIREGEALVVLVPANTPLVAELALRSADTGRLQPGDPARLKIDAFPWRRHGSLAGTLRAVAQDSTPDPTHGGALHRAYIDLATPAPSGAPLAHLPPGITLLPGMTLSADISIGTRSVLDFFLDPLLRGLGESLREP